MLVLSDCRGRKLYEGFDWSQQADWIRAHWYDILILFCCEDNLILYFYNTYIKFFGAALGSNELLQFKLGVFWLC